MTISCYINAFLPCIPVLAGIFTGCALGESATVDRGEISVSFTATDASTETDGTSTGAVGTSTGDVSTSSADPQLIQALFEANCAKCHGPESARLGGIDYITDLAALIANGQVVPGEPDASKVFIRINSEGAPMPPISENNPLSAGDVDLIRRWILDGAPTGPAPTNCEDNLFISLDETIGSMNADVSATALEDRRFVRYLTLTHLHNAGLCASEIDIYRVAISKLLNSLSREPIIVRPEVLGAEGTIVRIDLRDYGWNDNEVLVLKGFADVWEATAAENPFAIEYDGDMAVELKGDTQTSVPFQPADAFLQVASRGELYYDILKLPATVQELEKELGVADPDGDFSVGEIIRATFRESGVSIWNRIIERRRIPIASSRAYWRSYDFDNETDKSNAFDHPFDFEEAGGEIIFNLENGTQAYMLATDAGERILEAPTTIVHDPKQRDSVVKNGISCMSCHESGIIPKQDELLPTLDQYSDEEREKIESLHRPHDEFAPLQQLDSKNFGDTMTQAGIDLANGEPIITASLGFEADLDLRRAAAELGVTPLDLEQNLALFDPSMQVLRTSTISREAFTGHYQEAICVLLPGQEAFPACQD